jgi:hypothetical protein
MKANMGIIDRGIRIFCTMLIVGAYYNKEISGIRAIILLVISAIFFITSYISYCPFYRIFGISTRKNED